jgi:hypothetical protein
VGVVVLTPHDGAPDSHCDRISYVSTKTCVRHLTADRYGRAGDRQR